MTEKATQELFKGETDSARKQAIFADALQHNPRLILEAMDNGNGVVTAQEMQQFLHKHHIEVVGHDDIKHHGKHLEIKGGMVPPEMEDKLNAIANDPSRHWNNIGDDGLNLLVMRQIMLENLPPEAQVASTPQRIDRDHYTNFNIDVSKVPEVPPEQQARVTERLQEEPTPEKQPEPKLDPVPQVVEGPIVNFQPREEPLANVGGQAPDVPVQQKPPEGTVAVQPREEPLANVGGQAPDVPVQQKPPEGTVAIQPREEPLANVGGQAPDVPVQQKPPEGTVAVQPREEPLANVGGQAPDVPVQQKPPEGRMVNIGTAAPARDNSARVIKPEQQTQLPQSRLIKLFEDMNKQISGHVDLAKVPTGDDLRTMIQKVLVTNDQPQQNGGDQIVTKGLGDRKAVSGQQPPQPGASIGKTAEALTSWASDLVNRVVEGVKEATAGIVKGLQSAEAAPTGAAPSAPQGASKTIETHR